MSRSGTDVTELVAALCRGEMDLGSVLEAMSARGALPEAEYSAGVVTLQRFRAELDEDTLRELRSRMDALRAGGDDATVVSPVAARVPPPSPPPSPQSPQSPSPDGDVTRVEPRAPQPRPRETGAGTTAGTRASTSGSMASADWARIAEAEAGEVAGVGMLLKGRFLLERELGRGGMGVVYLARDERKVEAHDRDPYLAVKVLNDEFRRHPDSLVALQREARRSQQLAHDNIVRVYDFDKAGTIVFMTMEYIDGADLRSLIRERAFSGMPLARARPLIEGMGRALARAHAAGIVHSDFKPGNVMVTADGTAKVFDFGIARAGKHGGASGEITVFDAATLGALTPAYASLEMIEGGEPSPADDVYALGCVCYELLTGRHPFEKASAEVALREGRAPPKVKGLTRRQASALRQSVAFRAADRLPGVEALLEGLRDVPARERLLPLAGYGTALVLAAGGAGWGVHHWMHQRQLAAVVAGFSGEGGDGFADEAAAMAALSALSPDDRDALVLRENRRIEAFLLRRLDALWNPAQGRYDYVLAQGVFELRNRLRLFSPTLDARAQRMADEKHDVLNALDTRLTAQIESGAIFDVAGTDDAVDTLRNIRAMDPDSLLLRHPGLELAFAEAVAAATAEGRLELATARLEEARAVFPDSLRLELAGAGLEAALAEEASRHRPAEAAPRDAAAARTLLAARIAQPSADPGWQADVAAALELLREDGLEAGDQALVEALARAIAHQASGASEPRQLARASALVAFGLAQAPESPALLAEQARLAGLEQALEARLAAEAGQAEARARAESLRHAAAAGDLGKIRESLLRLREVAPGDAFTTTQAPRLAAGAWLEAADGAAAGGRVEAAAELLGDAGSLLGERPELARALRRYALVVAIQGAAQVPPDAKQHAALVAQLEEVARSDGAGLDALESQLRESGRLPEGSLRAKLRALAPAAAAGAGAPRVSPGRAAGERAGRVPPPTTAATTASAVDPDDVLPPVPDGPDPCGNPAFVGRGRFCYDAIGEGRGPTFVVVPGVAGGKPYALSRAEVTVNEFNVYCTSTGRCRPLPVATAAAGTLPATGIQAAQARAYARWLVHATGGWRHRLPTEAEWRHAAQAAAGWRQAPDSNCVPPTADAGSGGAPVSARGRAANPWGLINMSGNVWEWTDSGGSLAVHGGSYSSLWSECTVEARRADSGAAQADVGFRVLRELK